MAAPRSARFELSFGDEHCVAPLLYGGYDSAGAIVGAMGTRVYT
jgi:hypothetical protein